MLIKIFAKKPEVATLVFRKPACFAVHQLAYKSCTWIYHSCIGDLGI